LSEQAKPYESQDGLLRITLALLAVCLSTATLRAQSVSLPDAPSAVLANTTAAATPTGTSSSNDTLFAESTDASGLTFFLDTAGQVPVAASTKQNGEPAKNPLEGTEVDAHGNPIPLNHQQPTRILGFMPNFRSVGAGAAPPKPGWEYNFKIATRQATDWSSFIFLGLTTLAAEGIDEHPVLGKGVDGFYAYGWRGFLDKTDGTYIGAWFLPSLLHEDTRYYAMGDGHSIVYRTLYVMSRQVVTRTYGERQTPNIAGLGGKILTQIISRYYYPAGATSFGVLAEKFGYATMRDIAFTSVREFYPDIAAHYIRKHRQKAARKAAADAAASGVTTH
jgi:hypothetical protein